jgi:hypothetical protein
MITTIAGHFVQIDHTGHCYAGTKGNCIGCVRKVGNTWVADQQDGFKTRKAAIVYLIDNMGDT